MRKIVVYKRVTAEVDACSSNTHLNMKMLVLKPHILRVALLLLQLMLFH